MKKNLLIVITLFAIIMPYLYSGCVPSKPAEEVELLPTDRLIKKLEANRRKVKNFEGVGTIHINTSQINTNANFRVILLKPDSVYVEVFGPFGIDLAQILVTNNRFTFYDIIHNTVYRGNNNSNALEKIFKVNITFSDLMDAFVGAVNLTSKLTEEPENYEVAYNKYVLTYNDPSTSMKSRYMVDVKDLAITSYQLLNPSDKIVLEGSYSKFRVLENIPVPYFTEISQKSQDQNLKIEYRKIEINRKNQKINLVIPDDAEQVEI